MPHIIVEYSSNLENGVDVRRLIDGLHRTVVQSGLFEPAAVRTRAAPRSLYRIADGAPENVFLHITGRKLARGTRRGIGGAGPEPVLPRGPPKRPLRPSRRRRRSG